MTKEITIRKQIIEEGWNVHLEDNETVLSCKIVKVDMFRQQPISVTIILVIQIDIK